MKQHRRLIIFAIIITIIVISAGVALFLFLNRPSPTTNSETQSTLNTLPGVEVSPQTEKKADEAAKIAYEGNVEEGVKALDESISSATDSYDKFVFYSQKATVLFNSGDKDNAIIAAKSAYEIEKNASSAALVGQIAKSMNDTVVALDYYKKALGLVDSNSPFATLDREEYQRLITEIEGAS